VKELQKRRGTPHQKYGGAELKNTFREEKDAKRPRSSEGSHLKRGEKKSHTGKNRLKEKREGIDGGRSKKGYTPVPNTQNR